MTQKRRKRIDSVAGQTQVTQDAAKPCLEPPKTHPISKSVRPYWEAVINGKARQFWNAQELIVAAELSTNLYLIEKIRRDMLKADYKEVVTEGDKIRPNPLVKVMGDRVSRANRSMVLLKIHAEATQGESRDARKTNAAEAKAKADPDSVPAGVPVSDNPASLIPGLAAH